VELAAHELIGTPPLQCVPSSQLHAGFELGQLYINLASALHCIEGQRWHG
jgi:hypothetical protein